MKIHEISIKRPVTVFMCVLIVLVLGGVSLSKLSVDLMPDITFPIAIVSTNYSGVSPQEIESIVTKNIESAVATVSSIKTIQSQSSSGNSLVIAEFNSGTDMDFAILQIREKIDLIKGFLPDEVEAPLVIKMDPSMIPVASMSVSNSGNQTDLKKFVEDKVKPRLERLEGVASISISGGKTREIKVDVNKEKLSGYGLSFNQIISVLQTENLNQPAGTVEYGEKSLLVRSTGEFKNLDQIKNIPIILPNGNVIYIRDVAEVSDGFKDIGSYTRINGSDTIGISVQKQTSSNTVKVVNVVKDEINRIESEFPDIKINLVFDQGIFIEQSINNVSKNAIVGAVLAILILYVFLRNFRTTFIIGTAIPLSIIATFVMTYFTGITLNMVSLGGLALGVGMLVDNAIVVLENIYRHRSEGYSRIESAIKGTQEVGGAIIASTLTTVVVFLPIAFTEGVASMIFKELALTVTFSLLASLLVALTFIPMLSSKFLKINKAQDATRFKGINLILKKWDFALELLNVSYRKVLNWVLNHKKTTIVSAIVIFILSAGLVFFIGTEFFPAVDQGQFTVSIELPQGSLLEQTNEITSKVEKILLDVPEMDMIFVDVGSSGTGMDITGANTSRASISGTLKPLKERKRGTDEIVDYVRKQVELIAGADIKVNEASSIMAGGMGSSAVAVKISGPDFDNLANIASNVEDIVRSVEGTRQVESDIAEGRPEAQIYVDRDKASFYRLGTAQVAAAIRTSIVGQVATRYKVGGEEYDIRVQLPKKDRESFEQLKFIRIMTPTGIEVPLSDIANIEIARGPITISRESQQRYVTVSADIFGRDVGSVNNDIKSKLDGLSLPSGYTIGFGGQEEQMQEAFTSLFQMLLLAILLVYMIMASQFESLLHPFVIMFTLPLAFTGSVIGLVITQKAFSVPAFIGVIMLTGIVVNNAIVLIDYINTLRARGMDRFEAILKAGPTRLRPILMTTFTTILGLVPLALGIGEGAELEAPMAIVVIGGLLSSMILTLLIIPVIYTIFDNLSIKIKSKKKMKVSENFTA